MIPANNLLLIPSLLQREGILINKESSPVARPWFYSVHWKPSISQFKPKQRSLLFHLLLPSREILFFQRGRPICLGTTTLFQIMLIFLPYFFTNWNNVGKVNSWLRYPYRSRPPYSFFINTYDNDIATAPER